MDADGKLLAKVGQHVDSESSSPNGDPTTRIRTDVEIPSEGVHKSIVQNFKPDGQEIQNEKRRVQSLESADYLNNNVSK